MSELTLPVYRTLFLRNEPQEILDLEDEGNDAWKIANDLDLGDAWSDLKPGDYIIKLSYDRKWIVILLGSPDETITFWCIRTWLFKHSRNFECFNLPAAFKPTWRRAHYTLLNDVRDAQSGHIGSVTGKMDLAAAAETMAGILQKGFDFHGLFHIKDEANKDDVLGVVHALYELKEGGVRIVSRGKSRLQRLGTWSREKFLPGVAAIAILFICILFIVFAWLGEKAHSHLQALDISAKHAGYTEEHCLEHDGIQMGKNYWAAWSFPHLRCEMEVLRSFFSEQNALSDRVSTLERRTRPLKKLGANDRLLTYNVENDVDPMATILTPHKELPGSFARRLYMDTKAADRRMKALETQIACLTSKEDLYERAGNTPDEQGCYPFTCGIGSDFIDVLTEYRHYDGESWQLCE